MLVSTKVRFRPEADNSDMQKSTHSCLLDQLGSLLERAYPQGGQLSNAHTLRAMSSALSGMTTEMPK